MNVPQLSIVIPVYNEKENLAELIQRCLAACRQTGCTFEIILVDDGSRDGSGGIIALAADRHAEVVAVLLNRNYGQHAAVFAGLATEQGGDRHHPGCRSAKSAGRDPQTGARDGSRRRCGRHGA